MDSKTHFIIIFSVFFLAVSHIGAEKRDSVISLNPDMDTTVTVKKVTVKDCRAVRGFLGTPVDGSVKSRGYRGKICEYSDTGIEGYDAGAGVDYSYNDNDGIHITLEDTSGFDAVVLRGGAHTRMYADVSSLTEPQKKTPLCEFMGNNTIECVRFKKRIDTGKVSFFGTHSGSIADAGFYRVETGNLVGKNIEEWIPTNSPVDLVKPETEFAPESIYPAMKERYPESEVSLLALERNDGRGTPVHFRDNRIFHFITPPFDEKKGLDTVAIHMNVSGIDGNFAFTAVVQDPLDPRLDLMWLVFRGEGPGRYRLNLDFIDQVLLEGSRLWITLQFHNDVTISGPKGGTPRFMLSFTPVDKALPEALKYRKFLLKHFFCVLSETRPWGGYRKQSRQEFFSGNRYEKLCPELFMTIDQCHALDPEDATVRQYREWVYLRNLNELSEVSPPPEPPEGVPSWAWYPRLAWLEARKIARWWIDNRMVPTGEFGGMVGDDSDLYQQCADLRFFEEGNFAARLMDGAARMAELADQENLRGGINILVSDALHAYEEGINHLALMARWFYGDPIYYERCMESARNMEKLTILTKDGRRHFRRTRELGYGEIENPGEPTVEGRSVPLMWHTTLQAVDYNRNPRALSILREWADTWLAYMKPGQYASGIEVLTGRVTNFDKKRPLYDRGQAITFIWLYSLTGEKRYLEPFLHYYRKGEVPIPSNQYLGEVYSLGLLDALEPHILDSLARYNPALYLYRTGDPKPLIEIIIGSPRSSTSAISNLYDAQRWPDMCTSAEQFTDRLFFQKLIEYASVMYLGGYCGRNKFNPTHAVSWEGFGTDYAAMVLDNHRTRLKVLVYNYASTTLEGKMRVWALEHGRYSLSVGTDTDSDYTIDELSIKDTPELRKADAVNIILQPQTVTVVEIRQVEKLDPVFNRADLAIAAREVEVTDSEITGIIHNIGSEDVEDAIVAVIDADGQIIVQKSLGRLPAPVDLIAKRRTFTLRLPHKAEKGWKIVLDPESQVPEIYEGNNSVDLDKLPAVNYAH